jgi:hypothetical protein
MQEVSSNGVQFTNGNIVSPEFANLFTPIGNNKTIQFDHNGHYDNYNMKPAIYLITLDDGNGGQKEQAIVQVFAGYKVTVTLIGHAVSMGDGSISVDTYNIIKATYGITQCSQVVDVAAHTEYRYKKYFWSSWSSWSNNNPSGCNYREETCQVAATYKTVCVGETIDVTQNVKTAVEQGKLSFLFNNSKQPGGIFDVTTTNLLSQINDPAPGIVKNVMIKYQKNGVENTIHTMEYEVITL